MGDKPNSVSFGRGGGGGQERRGNYSAEEVSQDEISPTVVPQRKRGAGAMRQEMCRQGEASFQAVNKIWDA